MSWIKISAKSMRQNFHPCAEDYIRNVCQGRCCQGSAGIIVTVHDSEISKFSKLCELDGNFIKPDKRELCPFKTGDGFCSIHKDKPLGCKASPFTLTKKDTLIIRNRYRLLRCYNYEGSFAAYLSHAWSLRQIIGDNNYDLVKQHLDKGGGDIIIDIDNLIYNILKDNDEYKRQKASEL